MAYLEVFMGTLGNMASTERVPVIAVNTALILRF